MFSEILDEKDTVVLDYQDSYFNLTIKTTLMLKYLVDEGIEARHVIKADDDVFINVPMIISTLSAKLSLPNNFYCNVINQITPIREAGPNDLSRKWLAPYWMYPYPE